MSRLISNAERALIEGALKLARTDVQLNRNTRSIERQQTLAHIDEALATLNRTTPDAPATNYRLQAM